MFLSAAHLDFPTAEHLTPFISALFARYCLYPDIKVLQIDESVLWDISGEYSEVTRHFFSNMLSNLGLLHGAKFFGADPLHFYIGQQLGLTIFPYLLQAFTFDEFDPVLVSDRYQMLRSQGYYGLWGTVLIDEDDPFQLIETIGEKIMILQGNEEPEGYFQEKMRQKIFACPKQ